ncbi:MAG: membrane dipeptidase [Halioglobus sp.]
MKGALSPLVILAVLIGLFFTFAPGMFESSMNKVLPVDFRQPTPAAIKLHESLQIGDLHADSTLWQRDLLERGNRGQVDIPRLREGNVALQVFTTVTKSPLGLNAERNSADALDTITILAIAQRWPMATWNSRKQRAIHQASVLHELAARAPEEFSLILDRSDLTSLLATRASGSQIIGGIIGTEGSHALDGELTAIDELFDAGFRVMSLQHFFDNKLGGSLHGLSGDGLTEFGRNAVDRMIEKEIIIDVAHSSPAVVSEVLARSSRPLIVSHTGFYGHCQSPRNINDELMQEIAAAGGLMGVGYWDLAVCETSVASIVSAIRYGIDLVGEDHVALGSDFDGTVTTPLDTSQLIHLTTEMLAQNFTETEIRKVMGENILRFMAQNLPAK